MHRIQSRFGAFGVIAVFGAVQGDLSGASGVEVSDPSIEVSVTADRAAYAPNEPIAIRLDARNRTDTVVAFQFSDGQRYDFLIQDEGGGTRWRWSADKSFIQVLGEERLAPGDSMIYRERFEGPLMPGTYSVVGMLVATNHSLRASTTITVR